MKRLPALALLVLAPTVAPGAEPIADGQPRLLAPSATALPADIVRWLDQHSGAIYVAR